MGQWARSVFGAESVLQSAQALRGVQRIDAADEHHQPAAVRQALADELRQGAAGVVIIRAEVELPRAVGRVAVVRDQRHLRGDIREQTVLRFRRNDRYRQAADIALLQHAFEDAVLRGGVLRLGHLEIYGNSEVLLCLQTAGARLLPERTLVV